MNLGIYSAIEEITVRRAETERGITTYHVNMSNGSILTLGEDEATRLQELLFQAIVGNAPTAEPDGVAISPLTGRPVTT